MPGQVHAIKSIKIICRPCSFCRELERRLENAISAIEQEYKIKLHYKYHYNTKLKDIEKLSVNMASMPVIVINGRTEFASGHRLPTEKIIKYKLLELMRFEHLC